MSNKNHVRVCPLIMITLIVSLRFNCQVRNPHISGNLTCIQQADQHTVLTILMYISFLLFITHSTSWPAYGIDNTYVYKLFVVYHSARARSARPSTKAHAAQQEPRLHVYTTFFPQNLQDLNRTAGESRYRNEMLGP